MKKIVLFLSMTILMGISAITAFAVPEGKVPTCVKSTFYTQFPYAENIHWKKNKKGEYKVQFSISENKAEALINNKGVLVESDIVFFTDDVPLFVMAELKKEKDIHVIQFMKTVDINHEQHYLLTLRKGKEGFEVVFDKDWNVLQVYEKKNI
jgi:hypothetical protein